MFESKGVIPNNILLNFEKPIKYDTKKHTLTFDIKENIAWVIDGQHRLYGLSLSKKAIDIMVVAFENLSLPDQAKIFRIINSTQKGVNTSLIYDLIDLVRDASFLDERAHELVKKLNSDSDSPWFDQIKMLGVGKGFISQSAFVNNLKPLLDEEKRAPLIIYTEEEQYGILRNYFKVIKTLFPDDWGSKNSLLTKTMGFYALMSLLPIVLQHCLSTYSDFKIDSIMKILNPIKNYDFSSSGPLKGVSGKAGVERVIEELSSRLKDARSQTKVPTITL